MDLDRTDLDRTIGQTLPASQEDRRHYLIERLLEERGEGSGIAARIPDDEAGQRTLLRALLNVREPGLPDKDFLTVQDAYLQGEIARAGITDYRDLTPAEPGVYLWQGDITTLRCDAIVNAANDRMLGCFAPNHLCIDNAIHTFAGVQLRDACARHMAEQGHPEPTGTATITPAFNLPASYVLHTVGPIVSGRLTPALENALASCYRSCLDLALGRGLGSVAFCCISTGVFRFPADRAAHIAVRSVRAFQRRNPGAIDVVFNVFKEADHAIYQGLLGSRD